MKLLLFLSFIQHINCFLNGTYLCTINGELVKSSYQNTTLNLDVSGIISKNCDNTISYTLTNNKLNLNNYQKCFGNLVTSIYMTYDPNNDIILFETNALGINYHCSMTK